MATLAELNDRFRQGDTNLGQHVTTPVVQALQPQELLQLYHLVRNFDNFTEGDDPHGEHDFGKVTLNDVDYFWKIDYLDPVEHDATRRLMTLMRADEY